MTTIHITWGIYLLDLAEINSAIQHTLKLIVLQLYWMQQLYKLIFFLSAIHFVTFTLHLLNLFVVVWVIVEWKMLIGGCNSHPFRGPRFRSAMQISSA